MKESPRYGPNAPVHFTFLDVCFIHAVRVC